MLWRWIGLLVVWPLALLAVETETAVVLKEPVKFGLVINGKRVGETKVTAGAKVHVVKRDGPRVLIRHGNSEEVWVRETQVDGLEKHDPQNDLKEGKALLSGDDEGGNWARGVELIRRAAEADIPAAQREWGMLLIDRFCVEQDTAKGKELLRQAAAAGDGRAILEAASFEKGGEDMTSRIAKAADAGDPVSMVMLADSGIYGQNNAIDARSLLAKACESGDGNALAGAAMRYAGAAKDPARAERLGMSAEELNAKALEAYREAIAAGSWEAHAGLSKMFRDGAGLPKDEAEADRLFAEFRRRCEERVARGSFGMRFALVAFSQQTQRELDKDEALRMMQETIDQSDFAGHRNTAHVFAADILASQKEKTPEDMRAAIAHLEKIPAGPMRTGMESRIEQYKKTLAEFESARSGG